MLCPCGSKKNFENCCSPLINHGLTASSPEALMRSRYSAYAIKNANYLFETYAQSTRIAQSISEIQSWANETKWISLFIHTEINKPINTIESLETTKESDNHPQVQFTACYLQGNKQYQLTECSRFIFENDRWYYLDGDIIKHKEIGTIKRNDLCPCDSNKKFKQCCGR